MEHIILENKQLIAEIKTKGAELCRLFSKSFKKEIIWNGNPIFWARHAPVLFPIVGKVKNNEYEVNGVKYQLGQHGFARDLNFEIIQQKQNECTLQLKSSPESLTKYPYPFHFQTTFTLTETGIKTTYQIENIGESDLHFSLGAHPAFNCPFSEATDLSDYKITFPQTENSDILILAKSGLISNERSEFLKNDNQFPLSEKLFENDALIFDDLKSTSLNIESEKEKMKLAISWKNFPHLGIWKPLNAPFICIEPWQGMADKENHDGIFENKFGIICLQKNKVHEANYSVQVLPN